jgi:hypothetical protein
MLAQGIDAGDGLAEGLIEPAALPLDWLMALAKAGCEQLLLRGLPLGALPVPERSASPAVTTKPTNPVEHHFAAQVYSEARRRSWAVAVADFPAPAEPLLWWDQTVGDRWQVAGGDVGTAREQLGPLLVPHFSAVHLWDGGPSELGLFSRLLVTAHRPLLDPGQRDERLADRGVCLVMGHPSLADDLQRYLGPGWTVGAVYDVSATDLFSTG